ncbi:hypothetical protein [Candidatus Magnetominusculus xianensis]|uniref:Uncharacterized protein n=1 Tax=Candidatus Magnetominusculus xianensis TaxID=1748249 RepID=A0ABR5SI75_9BACT|nr:hypothetical protein [Candidatus Magnetominusculus xianensis]KWT90998.1 hypothetical protein ASN18_0945 [Candidatus Magnetominusculus xianensis]MBF0402609.1 hypothetical protein [Nitrospirota bacterium]
MVKHSGRICEKLSDPLAGKLQQEDGADDDSYWVEKAVEAEKSGYAGYEKSIEFLLEKLV